MRKVSIIGHFGENGVCGGGQSVKTVTIAQELIKLFGDDEVSCFHTYGKLRDVLLVFLYALRALTGSENVIILPAQNGLRIIAPLLTLENRLFRRKLHYVVIGGWLPEFLKKHKRLTKHIEAFHGVYVETNTMKSALEKQGFTNVFVMPNCKKLTILDESELIYSISEPFRLCTFSRVMKEKGIGDAVTAVKEVNERFGRTVYTLDIYGQVDGGQTEWFSRLQSDFPDFVRYSGKVPFDKGVDVLKNYFALLFPTHFYTEGVPGTVIDAYAAGIPVVASRWENFHDVIEDGITGYGFRFKDVVSLTERLSAIAEDPRSADSLKHHCLKKAEYFTPESAIRVLCGEI